MSGAEMITDLIASLFAIIVGIIAAGHWIGKKLDRWGEALVQNSDAVKSLSERVTKLEAAFRGRVSS